jgi:hypothetical protein
LSGSKAKPGVSLTDYVRFGNSTTPRLLPTPRASDWRSGKVSAETHAKNSRPLPEQLGGLLSPQFVCWLMDIPTEWINCERPATESYRLWLRLHGHA